MGHKNFYRNSNMETSVFGTGDRWMDREERFSQFDGDTVHLSNKRNNSKMGEAFKTLANTIGITAWLMGVIANFNNWIGLALGAAGFGFAVFRCLKERENWLIRRVERKERERNFKYNRTVEETDDLNY